MKYTLKYLNIAVCEDKIEEQEHLLEIIKNSEILSEVSVYNSGEEFLMEYEVEKFHLIFMDIYMSGISGLEAIRSIRKIDENILVAFTTNSMEHTLESYRLEAIKYIEKPIKEKPIEDLLKLAWIKKENTVQLRLEINGRPTFIAFNRIIYIEQKSHSIFLFLANGDIIRANEKLDNVVKQFEGQSFFRCHKSFLVNFSYVKSLDKELMVFVMKNNKNVHIRRESLPIARKKFEAYLFKMSRCLDNE